MVVKYSGSMRRHIIVMFGIHDVLKFKDRI